MTGIETIHELTPVVLIISAGLVPAPVYRPLPAGWSTRSSTVFPELPALTLKLVIVPSAGTPSAGSAAPEKRHIGAVDPRAALFMLGVPLVEPSVIDSGAGLAPACPTIAASPHPAVAAAVTAAITPGRSFTVPIVARSVPWMQPPGQPFGFVYTSAPNALVTLAASASRGRPNSDSQLASEE